ncbi:MAG: hypothetical protein, partial [Olavius algarvensis Gamma 1 endosymbiont]
PQRHRVNRLPRQLRPEWVVTPCRRLLARFRWYMFGKDRTNYLPRDTLLKKSRAYQDIRINDDPYLRGCLGTHFRNSLKIGRLDKINPLF